MLVHVGLMRWLVCSKLGSGAVCSLDAASSSLVTIQLGTAGGAGTGITPGEDDITTLGGFLRVCPTSAAAAPATLLVRAPSQALLPLAVIAPLDALSPLHNEFDALSALTHGSDLVLHGSAQFLGSSVAHFRWTAEDVELAASLAAASVDLSSAVLLVPRRLLACAAGRSLSFSLRVTSGRGLASLPAIADVQSTR